MMPRRALLVVLAAVSVAGGQQPNTGVAGVGGATSTWAGIDAGVYPITVTWTSTVVQFQVVGAPNQPFALAAGQGVQAGVIVDPNFGSVDILPGPAGYSFPLDGIGLSNLSLFDSWARTAVNGLSSWVFPIVQTVSTLSTQALVGDPAAAVGFVLSAASDVTLMQGQNLAIGHQDDSCGVLSLVFGTSTFYDQTYTQVWSDANGYIAFGGCEPFPTYTPTQPVFDAGPPCIAFLWADLNPAVGGSVNLIETPLGWTLAMAQVPNYVDNTGTQGVAAGSSNTVSCSFDYATGAITMDYTVGTQSVTAALVGITPGNTLAPAVNVVDFSTLDVCGGAVATPFVPGAGGLESINDSPVGFNLGGGACALTFVPFTFAAGGAANNYGVQ